jgi:hypothetical protein
VGFFFGALVLGLVGFFFGVLGLVGFGLVGLVGFFVGLVGFFVGFLQFAGAFVFGFVGFRPAARRNISHTLRVLVVGAGQAGATTSVHRPNLVAST